jgi:hypothetical protein
MVRHWRTGVGTVRLGRRQTVAGNRFSGEMPRPSDRGSLLEHGIGTTKTNRKVSLRACTRCSMPVGGEWNDITGFEWNE